MSQISNKKSSFPPRKQSSPSPAAPPQSKNVTYEECIKNYQKSVKALKGRILELESRLENSANVDSELIQLYKFAQVEWNKISEENTQLKKIISKERSQNQSSNQNSADNELVSTNLSLFSENQRLHSELKKKDSIIQSMLKETFSSNAAENQLKNLIDENIRLKNELETANMALSLNNNMTALDTFNKILLEKQKPKQEPNEALRLAQEENKRLQEQVHELESEIYEISVNNPELQASLEAEKQLRKRNKELEEKVYKLELQLKQSNKNQTTNIGNNNQKQVNKEIQNNTNNNSNTKNVSNNTNDNTNNNNNLNTNNNSVGDGADGLKDLDLIDDDENGFNDDDDFDQLNDDFVALKNTSDEDDEDYFGNTAEKNKKNEKKEFELTGDMAMFSAILAPLKKRLDERVRQVEMERMKKEGKFAQLKVPAENNASENANNHNEKEKNRDNSNENNNN